MSDTKHVKQEADPYDITQDAEIIKESFRDRRSRRVSSWHAEPSHNKQMEVDNSIEKEEEQFPCPTCPRICKSLLGRQRHISKCQASTQESHCPCCNVVREEAHLEGPEACDDCSGKFPTQEALDHHNEVMHKTKTFGCATCPLIFYQREHLIKHLVVHSQNKPWMCKQCNAVFTRKYHLDRHLRQSGCDGTKTDTNECQVCGKLFTRKDNLREHLRAHAGINKRLTIYTCEFCKIEIAGLHNYNSHKRDKHVGDRPYKCSYCNHYFPTSGAMKKHQRTHTGERPYECKECFKKFAAKETLNRHMRTHTNDRPYECPHCQKRFIQNSQLRTHLYYHTGEQDFKCSQCDKSFNRKQLLDCHVRYEHEKEEPFTCDHCKRTFMLKRDIEKHMITHTGEKAYRCDVCDKRFAQKPYLKVHQLTHNKEPPRACNYCNRAFIRQDCLLRHMRSKHRDKIEQILIEAERKKLQLQLLSFSAKQKSSKPGNNQSKTKQASKKTLEASISDMLNILVDEDTLRSFGAPDVPVDEVLKMVIQRCGHTPVDDKSLDVLDRLRENAKLLFTVVIDDAAVKALLNNQSVDEVIEHVLNLVKS